MFSEQTNAWLVFLKEINQIRLPLAQSAATVSDPVVAKTPPPPRPIRANVLSKQIIRVDLIKLLEHKHRVARSMTRVFSRRNLYFFPPKIGTPFTEP